MSQPTPPRRNPAAVVTAAILLTVAIAGTLVVPIYARSTPKWGDFPFFYWYLLISVPVIGIFCWVSYLLVRSKPGAGTAHKSSAGVAK
jgi:hypothetical protein